MKTFRPILLKVCGVVVLCVLTSCESLQQWTQVGNPVDNTKVSYNIKKNKVGVSYKVNKHLTIKY